MMMVRLFLSKTFDDDDDAHIKNEDIFVGILMK